MNIVISNSSEKPIYEQIVSQIKGLVIGGSLQPGDALPSIRFLAKELRISVITTKRAYDELEQEGYIETVAGKGSFISTQNRELIMEEHYRRIESLLQQAVDEAVESGISRKEVTELLQFLFEDEKGCK